MPRRGLPQTARMRHDSHYVEALASSSGAPVGRIVPIEQVDPNPDQPRHVMGDLSELMASITEKGIIEPLIVRQQRGRFQIIAGERRYQAAVQIGISEVPVIIRDVDDGEVIEIALIENIQRKELTPFEEADALKALAERFSYTHEQLARRLGKSRTSITESLTLNSMPGEVKRLCRLADISSKSILLQIARQPDLPRMISLAEEIAKTGMTRADARKMTSKSRASKIRAYSYKYKAPSEAYTVRLNFKRTNVSRDEVIEALEEILSSLKNQDQIQE